MAIKHELNHVTRYQVIIDYIRVFSSLGRHPFALRQVGRTISKRKLGTWGNCWMSAKLSQLCDEHTNLSKKSWRYGQVFRAWVNNVYLTFVIFSFRYKNQVLKERWGLFIKLFFSSRSRLFLIFCKGFIRKMFVIFW